MPIMRFVFMSDLSQTQRVMESYRENEPSTTSWESCQSLVTVTQARHSEWSTQPGLSQPIKSQTG